MNIGKMLGQISMYRLMLYFLLLLLGVNILLSYLGILPYNFVDILFSGIYLTVICNLSNYIFSKLVHARRNLESSTITALILTLITGPLSFFENVLTLTLIGFFAMASKYIFVVRKKHIFNPAAAAVLISAFALKTGASWWVGGNQTLPFILLGGFLVFSKIKRFEMIATFLLICFLSIILSSGFTLSVILNPSIWFFALVMLVEPLTSPSTRNLKILFGAFVALVYLSLSKIIPGYGYSLETALLAGNLFTFFVSPSFNIILEFRRKEIVARNTWSLYFEPLSKFNFIPGQYLEWTYPHKNPDVRGIRRYFTIASSPGEKNIMVTIRVSEKGSSFKSAILKMKKGEQIIAFGPQGDFVLPKDKDSPLVFIAGGIGITPFRSIIEFLLKNREKKDIVLLYSNSAASDVAFKDVFERAKEIGVKTYYIITERDGYIDEKMIKEKIPDYRDRTFYVSGPELMVEVFKEMLSKMKVKWIKTDYFPGYRDTYQK